MLSACSWLSDSFDWYCVSSREGPAIEDEEMLGMSSPCESSGVLVSFSILPTLAPVVKEDILGFGVEGFSSTSPYESSVILKSFSFFPILVGIVQDFRKCLCMTVELFCG